MAQNKGTSAQGKKKQSKVVKLPVENKRANLIKPMDYTFLFIVVLLVCIGLVMLLSASTPAARVKSGNSYHFFSRQFMFAMLGFVGMFVASVIDYRTYKGKIAFIVFAISFVALAAVLIPGYGIERNGATRWIPVMGIEFQPSEVMKFAIAMLFASWIDENKFDLKSYDLKEGMPAYYVALGLVCALLYLEPHMSGIIVTAGIGFIMLIVAGAPLKLMGIAGGVGGVAVGLYIANDPGRLARIFRFLDPFSDLQHSGYQISQSLYAIGSGGIFGKGLGRSVQKYSYLPEPYNDFIFSVVCEELGMIGAGLIIILFGALIFKGMKIAFSAPDKFGTLLGIGIMSQIGIQTILNIAVATSTFPNTGVSLPFFSYGGTSLLVLLCEMGIMLNISRHSIKKD